MIFWDEGQCVGINSLGSQLFPSQGLWQRVCLLPCSGLIDGYLSSYLYRHYSQQQKSFPPQKNCDPSSHKRTDGETNCRLAFSLMTAFHITKEKPFWLMDKWFKHKGFWDAAEQGYKRRFYTFRILASQICVCNAQGIYLLLYRTVMVTNPKDLCCGLRKSSNLSFIFFLSAHGTVKHIVPSQVLCIEENCIYDHTFFLFQLVQILLSLIHWKVYI